MKLPLALLFLPYLSYGAELSPELKTFLGPPPAKFEARYRVPARRLRKAVADFTAGHFAKAAPELAPLTKGAFAEHALFYEAKAFRALKEFAKSSEAFQRIQREYPASAYLDEAADLLTENTCELGLREARAKKAAAAEELRRCLDATPWKSWGDREEQATALFELMKAAHDPLFGPYVAELIQAMPASTGLRQRLAKEIKNADLEAYAVIPRFRTHQNMPAGVKPVFPDQVLFDEGMQAVLKGKWGNARSAFQQLEKDFPASEHLDRAHYWLARAAEATRDDEEAKHRFEAIFEESPLSFYGLQSALHLKKDFGSYLAPAKWHAEKFTGTPLPRQALSLWRLRALMEEGLLDAARTEAKELFFMKPGGSTFGQDNAQGAALTALLYDSASYSNGAFSQAYAAMSLDEGALNSALLGILFPRPYQKYFDDAATASDVHPLLLFSVAKQESAFLPNAFSKANAFGLMQLIVPTAKEMDPRLNKEDLFQPGPNVMTGARYLGHLLDRYQGNIALALAAYNAGPNRASQWQKQLLQATGAKNFDVDLFIDTIPFTETRRYVGSILRNYAWYKLLRKDGKVENVQELNFQWQKNKNEAPPPPNVLAPNLLPPGIAPPPENPLPPVSPQATDPSPAEATKEPIKAAPASPTSAAMPGNPPSAPTTPENPESTAASPR